MKKICIITFSPVEFLPPLVNLLNDRRWKKFDVLCCAPKHPDAFPLEIDAFAIRFVRIPFGYHRCKLANLWEKIRIYLSFLFQLIRFRPDAIFYIESPIALPVWLYRKFINRRLKLLIHYYEYMTPEEFSRSRGSGFPHRLEQQLYPLASWVSQCNGKRLEMFREDNGIAPEICRVIPNYPPRKWRDAFRERAVLSSPLKLVYVGALNNETMYVREMAEYVRANSGRVVWDIYSFQVAPETVELLREIETPGIRCFSRGISYDELPGLLAEYDVGLVLYRGTTMNYRYNHTNKFFEYLVLGLDVWCPQVLPLLAEYETHGVYPKVVCLDFGRLSEISPEMLADHTGLSCCRPEYWAEDAEDGQIGRAHV